MNCEQFIARLDNGEFPDRSSEDAKPFLDHANTCSGCKKALDTFEKVVIALQSIEPDESALSRIHQNIFQRISRNEKQPQIAQSTGDPEYFPFSFFGKNFSFAVCALIALLLIGSLAFRGQKTSQNQYSSPAQGELAFLSGGASIIRAENNSDPVIPGKELPLKSGDRFAFTETLESVLKFPDGRSVKISGKGECSLSETLRFERGLGDFSFQGSMTGYRVELPSVKLVILGTRLHLKADNLESKVWVQDGKIGWETPGGQKGNLVSGSGMKFAGGNITPITLSPLKENPTNGEPDIAPPGEAPGKPVLPGN